MGGSAGVALTSCLLFLTLLVGCGRESSDPAPLLSPLPLTATPIEQGEAARPILYTGVERGEIVSIVVTKAVYPSGRQVGSVVRTTGATWSPDGTQIAFVAPTGQSMSVANLQGEERTLINSPGLWRPYYAWPAWSPDGSKIALIEVGWCNEGNRISDLVVIDVATGLATSRYGPHDFWMADGTQEGPGRFSMPEALRWSPDGSKFLISWDNTVVLDFDTGKVERISDERVVAEWAPGSDAIYYFEVERRPGGRTISSFNIKTLGSESATVLADKQRLETLGMVGEPGLIPALLARSPSGSTMATATGQSTDGTGRLQVYGLDDGGSLALDAPSDSFEVEGRIIAMDWSPEEDSIAALVVDEDDSTTLQVLDLVSGTWKTVATPIVDVDVVDSIPTVLSWGR